MRKADNRLRITAQLIDARDGSHLWSKEYDRNLRQVFAIQTEIAEAIADSLRVPLGLDEAERLVSPTENLDAYDLYLGGRARMRARGPGVREAIGLFEAALAHDSSWAPAWAGLAESRALLPYYADEPPDSAFWARNLADAERAARKALALDPRNASALVALANVQRDRWEWNAAETAYQRALTVDPQNVEAYQQYADYLGYVGRFDDAYEAAHRALALDRSPVRLGEAGVFAAANRRYREAITLLSEAIAMDTLGQVSFLRGNLNHVYLLAGDWDEYRKRLFARLAASEDPELVASAREAWPGGGPPTPEMIALAMDEHAFHQAAEGWMILGDRNRALDALERHMDYEPPFGNPGLFSPLFDPLIDNPRFQQLLARAGLEGRRPQRLPPIGGA